MSVKLYVEGGGDSKELRIRCRAGFRSLIEKAGFTGRMLHISACGSRNNAYDQFSTAATALHPDAYPILLVDSEEPVTGQPWQHLKNRDDWDRPAGVSDDQAQLMVTCMETWIMADRVALQAFFKAGFRPNRLLSVNGLETRSRQDVLQALENATRDCGHDRMYSKGAQSFKLLAELDPAKLKSLLPYFQRFLDTLEEYL